ncbi:MAG: hypothetical protein WC503_07070 [Candidatus Shapirobacteria bacterium]
MFVSFLFLFLVSSLLFLVSPALAQCPICIVTVGGGMLIAQKLGIDDLLVSIWISALNTAISFWLAPKLKYKLFKNPWILSFIMLGLTLSYFQFTDQLGHLSNRLLGVDKIIFGQSLGLLAMFVGNFIYSFTKDKNDNKTLFPYAKVVFPFVSVLIITLIFKLLFKL